MALALLAFSSPNFNTYLMGSPHKGGLAILLGLHKKGAAAPGPDDQAPMPDNQDDSAGPMDQAPPDDDMGYKIKVPEGFQPPEGTEDGQDFEMTVKARMEGDHLCIDQVNGIPTHAGGDEEAQEPAEEQEEGDGEEGPDEGQEGPAQEPSEQPAMSDGGEMPMKKPKAKPAMAKAGMKKVHGFRSGGELSGIANSAVSGESKSLNSMPSRKKDHLGDAMTKMRNYKGK